MIDQVIERFIQYDIGKLKGAEGKKALDDFNRLGPEASFQLIDGLNRAADMESSCPAIIIAKKLSGIFLATDDIALLTFARENIGAGVTGKRHLGALKDLQFQCLVRKSYLQRRALAQGGTVGGKKSIASMTLAELEKSARSETGFQLKALLIEAEKRPGAGPIDVLALGIANPNPDVVKLSQGLLAKNLQRQSAEVLKTLVRHERLEVRSAAAQAIGTKKLRLGMELIGLLQDDDTSVRQSARRALVQLSGGLDYGPGADASFGERESAAERWRDWWSRQSQAPR